METTEQKRPTGMTILLVLSLINACWNILRSIIMYFTTPRMSEMLNNGQFEEMMEPFSSMGEEFTKAMNDSMTVLSQINTNYYLILLVLFIASLVGVIKMFRGDKRGLHIYAIAQILMLIDASVFVYPLQKPSPFFSDLLLTAIFILIYYLYFKRMDLTQDHQNQE
ncbi:MAG: hypothetical protein II670_09835 [Alphaproteobacteria bacterium]|nr:hypothetical protein [Alphaproteobacteria bacterium]